MQPAFDSRDRNPRSDVVLGTADEAVRAFGGGRLVTSAKTGGLARSGWPKRYADARNSSMVRSKRAEGIIRYRVSLGKGILAATAPVLTGDGDLVLAVTGPEVRCYRPGGQLRWRYRPSGNIGSTPLTGPTITFDGSLLFATVTGQLHAVDVKTGKVRWQVKLGYSSSAGVAVDDNGTAYVGIDGSLLAVDIRSGKVRWSFRGPEDAAVQWEPAVAQNRVVFSCGNLLIALSTRDGRKQWQLSGNRQFTSPCIGNTGQIIALNRAGYVVCLEPVRGAIVWRQSLGGPTEATAAVSSDGTIYAPTGSGDLAAFDLRTGKVRWRFASSDRSAFWDAPSLDGSGTLYIGSQSGHLIALRTSDGRAIWELRSPLPINTGVAVSPAGRLLFATDTLWCVE